MHKKRSTAHDHFSSMDMEALLHDLEETVKQLDDQVVPIEEAFKLFEKGVCLSKQLKEKMSHYERRIQVFSKEIDATIKQETPKHSHKEKRFQEDLKNVHGEVEQ